MKFIFIYLLVLCIHQSSWAEGDSPSPEGTIAAKSMEEERKRGTRLWSIPCLRLSRYGYGYGGVFLSRWGTAISWHNPVVTCIRSGEPAFTSKMTSDVLNGWMEGWLMSQMQRNTGNNFTLYGTVGGGLFRFQPEYYSFSKKLVVLRKLIRKKFELYRASIPTTISKFEEALDHITQEIKFEIPIDRDRTIECLTRIHGSKISFSDDRNFYRIQDESVLFDNQASMYNVPRTHKPSDTWTPIRASTGLSCTPKLIDEIFKKLKTGEVKKTMKQKQVTDGVSK